jgi:hypothetical protein
MYPSLAGAPHVRAAPRRSSLLVLVLAVPAVAQLACFAWTLGARLTYAMDLEWLEGVQLYEAFRFAHGLPVYGPPSQGFVPSPYPPLFHLVVAGLGRCFGFDYWIGRAVSGASIAVALGVQTAVVVSAAPRRGVGWLLALAGAAGVAAMYRPLQASMDLARVDTMGFAVVSVAALLARRPPLAWGRAAAVGATLCAAVYTKQTNAFYAAWVLLFLATRDRRSAARVVAVGSALALAALGALEAWTKGWFWTWMTVMRHHPLVHAKVAVTSLLLVPAMALFFAARAALSSRGWLRDATRMWFGMLMAAMPACVLPTLTPGGWLNNLVGLAFLAWLVALLMVCDALHALERTGSRAGEATRLVLAVLAAGLTGALYDPTPNVPDACRRRDVAALHALVRSLDGDVLVPMYPFLAARDGKGAPQVSLLAYLDAAGPGEVDADVARAIEEKKPAWVILCGHPQDEALAKQLGSSFDALRTDLHVQALREETGGAVTLLRRRDLTPSVNAGMLVPRGVWR